MKDPKGRPNATAPPIPANSTPGYTIAQKPPSTGDKVTICDGKNAKEKGGCMEPNDMRNPKTRPNALSPPGYKPSTPNFQITPWSDFNFYNTFYLSSYSPIIYQ